VNDAPTGAHTAMSDRELDALAIEFAQAFSPRKPGLAKQMVKLAKEYAKSQADPAKEIAELRRENKALGSWACSTCQARFTETVAPVLMEGVTRCSKCVEVEVLSGMLAAANKRAEEWEQASSELRSLLSVNRQAVKVMAARLHGGHAMGAELEALNAALDANDIARSAIEAARQADGGA